MLGGCPVQIEAHRQTGGAVPAVAASNGVPPGSEKPADDKGYEVSCPGCHCEPASLKGPSQSRCDACGL